MHQSRWSCKGSLQWYCKERILSFSMRLSRAAFLKLLKEYTGAYLRLDVSREPVWLFSSKFWPFCNGTNVNETHTCLAICSRIPWCTRAGVAVLQVIAASSILTRWTPAFIEVCFKKEKFCVIQTEQFKHYLHQTQDHTYVCLGLGLEADWGLSNSCSRS